MQETKAAIRYARALFSLAIERKELEPVSEDMILINKTIQENRDLAVMLKSPIIKSDKKETVIRLVFENKIGKTTSAFLDLIIKKRREMYVEDIARQFVILHLENNGVEEAMLVTAYPADANLRASVIALVEKNTGNKVVLEEKVDPSVLGGFILRYGDKQIDTSLEREFQLLRREFDKNLYVKDY
jgi:F-type H+-transporting ATPase subunit delta